jgi:hypothetical protein
LPKKRPTIGDVIEIETGSKLAYFQFTHKHQKYGALIRVFDGLHDSRPEDIIELVNSKVRFSTFFPLGAACNRGIVQIVDNVKIAAGNAEFPTFKTRAVGANKDFGSWYLWDGEREWRKADLSEGELAFPNRGVVNDTTLVKRIREGYSNLDYPK